MTPGAMFRTFTSLDDVVEIVKDALSDPARAAEMTKGGFEAVRARYSKERQWQNFLALL